MKHGRHSDIMKMAFYLGVVTVMLMPLAGCEEANMAIDVIFGKQLPVSIGIRGNVPAVIYFSEKAGSR